MITTRKRRRSSAVAEARSELATQLPRWLVRLFVIVPVILIGDVAAAAAGAPEVTFGLIPGVVGAVSYVVFVVAVLRERKRDSRRADPESDQETDHA